MGPLLPWGPSHSHSAQASRQHTALHLSSPSLAISLLDRGIPPYSSCLGLNPLSHAERGSPDLHQILLKKRAKAWECLMASSWTSQGSSTAAPCSSLLLFIFSACWWCLSNASHILMPAFFSLKLPSHPLLTICSLSAPTCRYLSVFAASGWLSPQSVECLPWFDPQHSVNLV